MDMYYVLKFQVKAKNARKDYWEMCLPLFIIDLLTATSL